MKTTFMMTCLLFACQAFATEQELTLQTESNGQPQFGIQYSYDVNAAWVFTYTTTISNQTLATLPNSIFWIVIDTQTNQPFNDWSEINNSDLVVGSLGISSKPALANLLPNLRSAKVAFGTKNAQGVVEVLFSIPLGPLCQNYPTHFMDLTNSSKAACTVSSQDIPDWQSECKQLEKQFLSYVKKGSLTCEIAKKQFAKRACGVLPCQ